MSGVRKSQCLGFGGEITEKRAQMQALARFLGEEYSPYY
ncbi:MAG: hypothetical protein IBGAMO2_520007 [Arenicellales bacterium IbO2]|nr:MAG: hypothetical protein IBGAMO2_520007 [Arenicellales bacterium IbO2]